MISGGWFDVSGTVSYGTLEINRLGWQDGYQPTILARRPLAGWDTIAAHAPSRVELVLREPAEVFAFMNLSACCDRTNAVELWIDCNYLGQAEKGGDESAVVRLDPGRHTLLADPLAGQAYGRHTIWALRRAQELPAVPDDVARPENTAVLTIACYDARTVHRTLAHFAYSARKQGIWFEAFGGGEQFGSWFSAKILRMRKWLDALPARYSHVLYCDGKDSVFIRPLADLCGAFNSIGQPIIVGAEAGCFPLRGSEWANRFPKHPTGRNWICAGYWMGRRAALIDAMDRMIEINGRLAEGRFLPEYAKHQGWANDDQFLWQLSHLIAAFPFALDHECRIGANVATQETRLTDNRDFDIKSGKVTDLRTGNRPGVIHFSSA